MLNTNLKKVTESDKSSFKVHYYTWRLSQWVYTSVEFTSEKGLNHFLDKIKKDLQMKLIDVEKRTIVYEKYKP